MATHKVVNHDQWLAARKKHLAKEKEFTRLRDQLSRERRTCPGSLSKSNTPSRASTGRRRSATSSRDAASWPSRPPRAAELRAPRRRPAGPGVLWSALGELPPHDRAVIVLRDVEQMSVTDVADTLGIAVAAVKARTHRARLRLRQRLSSFMERDHRHPHRNGDVRTIA